MKSTVQRGYKAHAIQRGETFSVLFAMLRPKPGFNERRLFTGIPDLASRIQQNGFRKNNPLTVEWNPNDEVFDIIHGERRYQACAHLDKQGIDPGPIWCMSESRDTSKLQQIIDQVITNTGEPFTPLEKGRAYLRMIAEDSTLNGTRIAEIVGETKQAVSNALRLAKHGSNALHFAIDSGRIASTTAESILKEAGEDHAAQDAMLEATLSGKTHATPKDLPSKPKPAKETTELPGNTEFIAPDPDQANDASDSSTDHCSLPTDHSPDSTSSLAPADPGAIERIKNAPSVNRDGSSGPGEGKYEAPDKRLKSIEVILDKLANRGEGHEARITTTEIVLGYLNNERSAADLKNHLVGK
jgi:ParB/RepB/Spo0J family partition protein